MVLHKSFGVALTVLSLQVFAGTAGDVESLTPYRTLATVTIGPDFVQQGQAQTLIPIPPFEKHYTNANPSTTVVDGGGFIGIERAVNNSLWIQLGISAYGDSQMHPQGEVWLFALPEFNTLSYTYHVNHARVMAEGKFLTTFNRYQMIHPYVSWGLGAAFNRASNYQETALIPGAIPTLPFANHTQTSFTWGLGVGIDYAINPRARLGVGYQFADLGSVSLGATPASITPQTLSFSHLYTNQLRFQFTYLV